MFSLHEETSRYGLRPRTPKVLSEINCNLKCTEHSTRFIVPRIINESSADLKCLLEINDEINNYLNTQYFKIETKIKVDVDHLT